MSELEHNTLPAHHSLSARELSKGPGVYVFRNKFGEVIYVGKARNLRRRVSSYLTPSRKRTADPKLRSLIKSIASFDIFEVKHEEEALLLESQLIKKYTPRYNIELRDDKRFLLIKLDVNASYPRMKLVRLKKGDNALYYGPFPHAGAVKQTIDYLARHFGLRTCSARVPGEKEFKHCLDSVVRNCSAPCIDKVTQQEYLARITALCKVLDGNDRHFADELREKMVAHAEEQEFEKAARLRDVIENLKSLFIKKVRRFENAVISQEAHHGVVDELQKVLYLPKRPVRIECFDNSNLGGQMAVASMVCFIDGKPATKEYRHFKIKTVEGIDDFASMEEIVTRRYSRLQREGKPLPDLILVDGGKGQLHSAVIALHKLDLFPVMFTKNATPTMRENQVVIMGLAKRNEELFIPGRKGVPVVLPKDSSSLRLLQYVRDEAHRFAITFHRSFRNKAITNSILDEIDGIGDKRKKVILKAFGSVARLKKASPKEIVAKVSGIGLKFAQVIHDHLNT